MLMTPVAATDDTLAIVAEPLNGSPVLSFINLDTGDATTTDLPDCLLYTSPRPMPNT